MRKPVRYLLSPLLLLTAVIAVHAQQSALQHAEQHLDAQYVCPMHAQITDNRPAECPICGMSLEKVEVSSAAAATVKVPAAMQHSFGVKLAHAEIGKVAQEVYASGFVEKISPAQTRELSSRVDAGVAEILVQPGQWVQQDDVLLTLDYAPYKQTLEQYLQAMEDGRMETALDMRSRLQDMGVSDAVLAGFDEQQPLSDKLEIVAPFSGEILEVVESSTVVNGDKLLTIRSPSLAEADLRSYSRIARGVDVGHVGRLHVSHLPGRSWPGRVVEVIHNRAGFYSTLRFHVEVPGGALEPGAFAGAYVDAGTRQSVLRVPSSAVIHEEDSTRVVRWNGGDEFEVVEVALGFEGHQWTEIRSGLQQGDHVVTRAQFLIDSEATLKAGLKRLTSPEPHRD